MLLRRDWRKRAGFKQSFPGLVLEPFQEPHVRGLPGNSHPGPDTRKDCMSYKQLTPAWDANLPCHTKMVLISLADQANDEGICWPRISTLIKRTGLEERAIYRHLSALEKLGHIHRETRPGKSNIYHIHPVTPVKMNTTGTTVQSDTPVIMDSIPLSKVDSIPLSKVTPITVIEPKVEPKTFLRPSVVPSKKSSSIPADFNPNETGYKYADERKVNIARELTAFVNHHQAKGSTMKDWQAAWRTWCDNSVKFGISQGKKEDKPVETDEARRARLVRAAL